MQASGRCCAAFTIKPSSIIAAVTSVTSVSPSGTWPCRRFKPDHPGLMRLLPSPSSCLCLCYPVSLCLSVSLSLSASLTSLLCQRVAGCLLSSSSSSSFSSGEKKVEVRCLAYLSTSPPFLAVSHLFVLLLLFFVFNVKHRTSGIKMASIAHPAPF